MQLYRTLATVGITSAVFAHESTNNPLKIISQSIKKLHHRAIEFINDLYDSKFKKPIERIMRSVESLSVLTNVTLSLADHEKRRASRINIHQVVRDVIELYQPFINERDVKVNVEFDHGNPYLRGSIAALESIISNLLNNSLAIFEKKGKRNVFVKNRISSESISIRVFDNGPGIEGINIKDIWLPGQTTKKNGTCLGLTIVRDAAIDLGGNVKEIRSKADGAIFDYYLKTRNFADFNFNGAEVVSRLYDLQFPALLVTIYSRAKTDEIRLFRRNIPVLIPGLKIEAGIINEGIRKCMNEFKWKNNSFSLLPGDIDKVGLDNLLEDKKKLQAWLAVFPHHGGKPGNSDTIEFTKLFCKSVKPKKIIFSIGDNIKNIASQII